jgi:hypothetical protein
MKLFQRSLYCFLFGLFWTSFIIITAWLVFYVGVFTNQLENPACAQEVIIENNIVGVVQG